MSTGEAASAHPAGPSPLPAAPGQGAARAGTPGSEPRPQPALAGRAGSVRPPPSSLLPGRVFRNWATCVYLDFFIRESASAGSLPRRARPHPGASRAPSGCRGPAWPQQGAGWEPPGLELEPVLQVAASPLPHSPSVATITGGPGGGGDRRAGVQEEGAAQGSGTWARGRGLGAETTPRPARARGRWVPFKKNARGF